MFLQVRWPNQQCQSTEGGWLAVQIALNLTRLISPCYNNTTGSGRYGIRHLVISRNSGQIGLRLSISTTNEKFFHLLQSSSMMWFQRRKMGHKVHQCWYFCPSVRFFLLPWLCQCHSLLLYGWLPHAWVNAVTYRRPSLAPAPGGSDFGNRNLVHPKFNQLHNQTTAGGQ